MNQRKNREDLLIDPEFERLQIPLPEEEYRKLIENILAFGVRRAIHTWNGYIIDGHKRFKICKKYGISFSERDYHFSSRWEVLEWICSRNLSRSDLAEEYKKYYLGKRFLICSDPKRKSFA